MEKMYHRGVYGILVKSEQQILLVKKSRGPYTGKFDLPGGRLEVGETDEQALVRELYEETGVMVFAVEFVKEIEVTTDYQDGGKPKQLIHSISLWWITDYSYDSVAVILTDQDVSAVCWKAMKSLEKNNVTPAVQEALYLLS